MARSGRFGDRTAQSLLAGGSLRAMDAAPPLAGEARKDTFILKQKGSTVPADFGGAHYYEYDLNDLAAGQAMLQG